MRNYFCCGPFLFVMLTVVGCPMAFAQTKWNIPQLHELDWKTDQIGSGKTKLSKSEVRILEDTAAHAIGICMSDPGPGDPHTAAGLFSELRIERVRIGPEKRGILVQGSAVCMCGATGNCDFWLFDEDWNGIRLVLKTTAIQSFDFEKSISHGYFDLILGSHDSASERYLQQFQFDGNRYRRVGCAQLNYMDYNTMKALKTPSLGLTPCGEGRGLAQVR